MIKLLVIIASIIVAVAAGVGVIVYYVKQGKIADRDNDFIPDVVEDTIEDVKVKAKEAKRRAKNIKEELQDVVVEAKELGNQIGDVSKAAQGKKRQGRRKNKL